MNDVELKKFYENEFRDSYEHREHFQCALMINTYKGLRNLISEDEKSTLIKFVKEFNEVVN